ncbi:MAG: arsenate reductase (glutaredoxin) [Mycobacterium sp.]|nr:arsenate reductase (glutaredoxin) [Mycobacterium sp.]MBV9720509.1 arsenate reductase (glutaredoxin) [Mycobacterium sp.]
MVSGASDTVIYHNPRCTSSRKTLEWLRDNGVEPVIVEYIKTPPSRADLMALIRDAGIEVRGAVRKRELLYTELDLADANDDQSPASGWGPRGAGECPQLDAMAEHPILIERPFVVTPKGTRLARPVDTVREIL